ncbi:hypothetical protein ITK37_004648 [Salmonella enterica]|nr:hypothetical protein [Salmonella enterica]EBS0892531.1 hypothetical protein [Salmonella enterica subsp. enterica serovar Abaetetuba]ECE0472916.1 hypothetical protein [Salmonella enterica subsp. enterica serovar Glostrup]ECH8208607.1 hypothetical protein [Salmonella enterica subsp. enterica]EAX7074416.1 hypothetical protein [Salmonella enterica]
MKIYQKSVLFLGSGLVISALAHPVLADTIPTETLTASFMAYDVADFSAAFIPASKKITTDRLEKNTLIGTINTTQPSYARYRDIKFTDNAGKSGVLTFTHAEGKQSIEIVIPFSSMAGTVNGLEGSSGIINKTTEQFPLAVASEYNQIPAGEYSDTITVSYDTL